MYKGFERGEVLAEHLTKDLTNDLTWHVKIFTIV